MPKVDNGNLAAKLDLRRYFLRKYYRDGSGRVMDCCQGSGLIWHTLRREFILASYWGLDTKPKPGRLSIDSSRVLTQPGWSENIIDIDTYGFPWTHFAAAISAVKAPTTFFLTVGNYHLTPAPSIRIALGLGQLAVPPGILVKLYGAAAPHLLSPATYGRPDLAVIEARGCESLSARYYGLRIEPKHVKMAEKPPEIAKKTAKIPC